jgi:hypothetical protein
MTEFICHDRFLSDSMNAPPGVRRIILLKAKKWQPGEILDVQFMGGTAQQQANVQVAAREIEQYANISFRFSGSLKSIIRISFVPQLGAWSMIGTDARGVPRHEATLNLGFEQPGVAIHELGHALGCLHEHQSPFGEPIRWNEAEVIRDLSGPPNRWDIETIRRNVFEQYSRDQLNGSVLDPLSIWMYPIPARWTTNGFSTTPNPVLSLLDKQWLAKEYPGRVVEPPPVEPVNPCAGLLSCWQALSAVERGEILRQGNQLVDSVSKIGQLFLKG